MFSVYIKLIILKIKDKEYNDDSKTYSCGI